MTATSARSWPRVYVVFPVFNRIASTKKFLACMAEQTYENVEVVMCDDGSTDGTAAWVYANYPAVRVLSGTGDLWWSGGINRCILDVMTRCTQSDFVLTINNDVFVTSDYIERKVARALENPRAVIGSVCLYMNDPKKIETSGFVMNFRWGVARSLTRRGQELGTAPRGLVEATHLPAKGVLFPIEVFQKIGLFDAERLPQYHADTDLTLRAFKSGYGVFVDFDSPVYSDINLNNMTIPGQKMTLAGIIKTFRGPYAPNNLSICKAFADKHFSGPQKYFYLTVRYAKIIGGMSLRYLRQIVAGGTPSSGAVD